MKCICLYQPRQLCTSLRKLWLSICLLGWFDDEDENRKRDLTKMQSAFIFQIPCLDLLLFQIVCMHYEPFFHLALLLKQLPYSGNEQHTSPTHSQQSNQIRLGSSEEICLVVSDQKLSSSNVPVLKDHTIL